MKIIFDVGANNGSSTKDQLESGNVVYAFEPTPELCENMRQTINNPCVLGDYDTQLNSG
jgi:FkbM family methyltransferase